MGAAEQENRVRNILRNLTRHQLDGQVIAHYADQIIALFPTDRRQSKEDRRKMSPGIAAELGPTADWKEREGMGK